MKKKFLLPLLFLGSIAFAQTIQLQEFATNITAPVQITNAGDSNIYVAQQNGIITTIGADGTVSTTPFLDISTTVNFTGEMGLLGLTFHPDYATNGYLYVDYLDHNSNTVIARYTRSAANPNIADPASAHVVLNITQAWGMHQGGCVSFGPDGYLYISSGDGGPNENGQNTSTLLGKILRIDVNNGTAYSIPDTNPFATTDGSDEIWAYGLRNPWKFSFNRLNGDMWLTDVGQNAVEEINKISAATTPGLNFGWRCYEGTAPYDMSANCPEINTITMPFVEYTHTESGGCSITGGYVYTGTTYPNMQNKYIFADYCSNKIGWVNSAEPGAVTWTESFTGNFTTLGEDVNGELYIAGGSNGIIYKITDATASATQFSQAGITLYPNPANNEVFITLKDAYPLSTVTLYDMGGKLLIQQQLILQNNRIDTSALQAGIYMLEINTGGSRMQQKLVIN